MKKLLIIISLFIITSTFIKAEDTGTYKIQYYKMQLIPHSDGKVTINCYQKWLVTGGHIPWVTIGLPNSDFTISSSGQNVKLIAPANESSWSGVKIDLDKDYQPGETFEVYFVVDQNRLFYADDNNYKLDYTPGWYDNAFTDYLEIEIYFFAKLDSVKTDPQPTVTKEQEMIWKKTSLGKGEKFNLSISFPKSSFPQGIKEENLQEKMSIAVIILIVILIIVIIGTLVVVGSGGSSYSGGGGGIFYGGSSDGLSGGGGGGFGGRSSSCDCACVSCACACACAGGGGAGCSRKSKHSCPKCKNEDNMKNYLWLLLVIVFISCSDKSNDSNNEPPFPSLHNSWLIDLVGVVNNNTLLEVNSICNSLQKSRSAEMVILICNKIKQPEKYATHYGRWLKLGKKGLSTEGGNNGIVWLIRPDAKNKITISIGSGLPKFTSVDYGEIIDTVIDYINFGNYDLGIKKLAQLTNKKIRGLKL